MGKKYIICDMIKQNDSRNIDQRCQFQTMVPCSHIMLYSGPIFETPSIIHTKNIIQYGHCNKDSSTLICEVIKQNESYVGNIYLRYNQL